MNYKEYVAPAFLICMSVAGFIIFAYVATERALSNLEGVLLQAFFAVTGFTSTFMIGRRSAREAAAELVKPHARSAFRRLLSQYQSLHRMTAIIAASQSSEMSDREKLARLEEIALTQISTAGHALEDWVDIVPEDVAELRKARSSRRSNGGGQ